MSTPSIPLRELGKNGPKVPALGFGLLGMSVAYGEIPSDEERFAILDRALELGATFWDSADLYGDSEELLGKWFKRTGKRDRIFLATKYGFLKGDKKLALDSSGEYCKKACAESLRILDIDSIDLYYLHQAKVDIPIEDSMRALAELKAEGKIKHIGLSNVSSNTLRRAYKVVPVAAVQVEYSPFLLEVEGPASTNLLATCRELGVTLIAYSPLGRGLLTSTFASNESVTDAKDMRWAIFPRFLEANRDNNVKIVNQFKAMADRKGCSTSQLSIAWLLRQGDDIIPNPGTKKIRYLEDNWGALQVQLSDEEVAEIRKFAETADIAGGSLPPMFAASKYVDTKEES